MSQRYALNVVSGGAESATEKGDDKVHSGRLLLRMPRALHAELAGLAEKRGISLNQLIVGLLSNSVSGDALSAAQGTGADSETRRRLQFALTVNLVVLVVVGVVAIALLVFALTGVL
jgi:HicB family